MPVIVPIGSKFEIRLEKEALALARAIRLYIRAQGGVVDDLDEEDDNPLLDIDGLVTRANYLTGADVCGLVVVKGEFADGWRTFVTAPGRYFGSDYLGVMEMVVAAVEPHHRAELVEKTTLQAYAVDADGQPRRIRVRVGPRRRPNRRRRMAGAWRPSPNDAPRGDRRFKRS